MGILDIAQGGLNALDLAPSIVRDLAANALTREWRHDPFDQISDPFGRSGRIENGREVLREAGLAGSKDTWGNFAAGLLFDALSDPINYQASMGMMRYAPRIFSGAKQNLAANLAEKAGYMPARLARKTMVKNAETGLPAMVKLHKTFPNRVVTEAESISDLVPRTPDNVSALETVLNDSISPGYKYVYSENPLHVNRRRPTSELVELIESSDMPSWQKENYKNIILQDAPDEQALSDLFLSVSQGKRVNSPMEFNSEIYMPGGPSEQIAKAAGKDTLIVDQDGVLHSWPVRRSQFIGHSNAAYDKSNKLNEILWILRDLAEKGDTSLYRDVAESGDSSLKILQDVLRDIPSQQDYSMYYRPSVAPDYVDINPDILGFTLHSAYPSITLSNKSKRR